MRERSITFGDAAQNALNQLIGIGVMEANAQLEQLDRRVLIESRRKSGNLYPVFFSRQDAGGVGGFCFLADVR